MVQHLEDLFKAASTASMLTFVSPHYYYPHDHQWKFEGPLEKLMHNIRMFECKEALNTQGFSASIRSEKYEPDFIEQSLLPVAALRRAQSPYHHARMETPPVSSGAL